MRSKAMDALALAEKNVYDMAVLDMKMPGTGGLELRGLLEQKYPNMKFIFLTGHGSEDDYVAGSSGSAAIWSNRSISTSLSRR